jgi:hypothetical protein
MTKPQVQEIDAGEIIVRDYTVAELAEVEKAIEQEEVVKALKAEAVAKKAAACSTRTNNRRLKSTRNKLTERYVVTNGYNI